MSGESTLQEEIASIEWYHTLELERGLLTPGWQDTRSIAGMVPFPSSLAGMRCLDVGTFDGFWAFEMEKRGAAEVVAIDILDPDKWDWPVGSPQEAREAIGRRKGTGSGFEMAKAALGSSVTRVEMSVYDASPETLGHFDLVYLGSLLVHLQNPVRALERLRSVCSGTMIVLDGIDLPLSLALPRTPVAHLDGKGRPWWWYPNLAALRRLVEAGGFEVIEGPKRIYVPPGKGQPLQSFHPRLLTNRAGLLGLTIRYKGDPHGLLVARPAT